MGDEVEPEWPPGCQGLSHWWKKAQSRAPVDQAYGFCWYRGATVYARVSRGPKRPAEDFERDLLDLNQEAEIELHGYNPLPEPIKVPLELEAIVPETTELGRDAKTPFYLLGDSCPTSDRRFIPRAAGTAQIVLKGTDIQEGAVAYRVGRRKDVSRSSNAHRPDVFLSYRRDAAQAAGRLKDRLKEDLGQELVFFDRDDIRPGDDFPQILKERVSGCTVFLMLMSSEWTERLHRSDDYVRQEVEWALETGVHRGPGASESRPPDSARQGSLRAPLAVHLVPILEGKTTMPEAHQLPLSIRSVVNLNAAPLRPDPDFERDVSDLLNHIRSLLP